MKKLLSIGLLSVCALAFSDHRAQAWVNSRFSIGLNWHHQSGNTSTLWGLWRNGQVPGPEAFGGGGHGGPPAGMGGGAHPGGMPPAMPFPWTGGPGMPMQPGNQPISFYPQPAPGHGFPQAFPVCPKAIRRLSRTSIRTCTRVGRSKPLRRRSSSRRRAASESARIMFPIRRSAINNNNRVIIPIII
jgi:hypothetical protein